MINWTSNLWSQIKNTSKGELIAALLKDGWVRDPKIGAVQVYYNPVTKKRVTIHYHNDKETYRSAGLLKNIISDIGWSEKDLQRLKLIK